MPDWLEILVAAIAVVTGVGGGIAWLISRHDIHKASKDAATAAKDAKADADRANSALEGIKEEIRGLRDVHKETSENENKLAYKLNPHFSDNIENSSILFTILNDSSKRDLIIRHIYLKSQDGRKADLLSQVVLGNRLEACTIKPGHPFERRFSLRDSVVAAPSFAGSDGNYLAVEFLNLDEVSLADNKDAKLYVAFVKAMVEFEDERKIRSTKPRYPNTPPLVFKKPQ